MMPKFAIPKNSGLTNTRTCLNYLFNIHRPKQIELILWKDSNQNSFHMAMKMPITLMQIFSFLPVNGVRGSDYRSLQFRWWSWKVSYALVSIFGYIFNFGMYWINHPVDNILEINAIMFHTITISMAVLFINLARKWPNFVKEWQSVEVTMKSYEINVNIRRKIISITATMMLVASVEHFMVMGNRLYKSYKGNNGDSRAAWRQFFTERIFPEVFKTLPYHPWAGFTLQFMIIQKTFIWTFVDVFIISVSVCLTYRLTQINKKLHYLVRLEVCNIFIWRTIRKDYIKISRLVASVNNHLSWFIMISFISNLFYILTQLFSSLRPKDEIFQKVYFYVSFALLNFRLISMCIFGGAVNDQTMDILRILSSAPSRIYNIEIERFLTNLTTCDLALTGKNFFRITRSLVLKIASAIVTYELVLIQFNIQDFKNGSY